MKNYIDGEKETNRTSAQLTDTHSQNYLQKLLIFLTNRQTSALC